MCAFGIRGIYASDGLRLIRRDDDALFGLVNMFFFLDSINGLFPERGIVFDEISVMFWIKLFSFLIPGLPVYPTNPMDC